MADLTEFKIGDKVHFINARKRRANKYHYPECGTAGKVVGFWNASLLVQWPVGSTSKDDTWYCSKTDVRKAEE